MERTLTAGMRAAGEGGLGLLDGRAGRGGCDRGSPLVVVAGLFAALTGLALLERAGFAVANAVGLRHAYRRTEDGIARAERLVEMRSGRPPCVYGSGQRPELDGHSGHPLSADRAAG
jgi:hypothetical protein